MEQKRYNTFSEELKQRFGCRVHRISVDAGFSCPNRDGTLATSGCIYCAGNGSGAVGIDPLLSISRQIEAGKEVMTRKYKAAKFIGYFQAFSNTYAPLETLKACYDEALAVNDVVGLIIGTRPDCLPSSTIDLLQTYAETTYFWLEIGLQSATDRVLNAIGRGHDVNSFTTAVANCKKRGLRVCAHIILGLPGETRDEMLSSAGLLNELGVDGVKIHLLHVLDHTPLADMYHQGAFSLLDRDQYVGLVCDYLELLNPRISIQRLTGDGHRDTLVAPLWSLKKFEVLNLIDHELMKRDSRQGLRYSGSGGN